MAIRVAATWLALFDAEIAASMESADRADDAVFRHRDFVGDRLVGRPRDPPSRSLKCFVSTTAPLVSQGLQAGVGSGEAKPCEGERGEPLRGGPSCTIGFHRCGSFLPGVRSAGLFRFRDGWNRACGRTGSSEPHRAAARWRARERRLGERLAQRAAANATHGSDLRAPDAAAGLDAIVGPGNTFGGSMAPCDLQ